jgi:hypothetical protein
VSDDYGWLITEAAAQRAATSSNPAPTWLDGVVGGAEEKEGLNHQVDRLRSPPIPPQCPECCGNPRFLCRGTKSSNPSPSSGESANFRFRSRFPRGSEYLDVQRQAGSAMAMITSGFSSTTSRGGTGVPEPVSLVLRRSSVLRRSAADARNREPYSRSPLTDGAFWLGPGRKRQRSTG